jgi:23S rRNA pseudouridine1911/1915/1917 synthase
MCRWGTVKNLDAFAWQQISRKLCSLPDLMTPTILYEDNHLVAINKPPGLLVHGDKTGDPTAEDFVADWLRDKYDKPGNIFVRSVHRLDRPVSGVLVIGKTSKGHSRMATMFKQRDVKKIYWALTARCPHPTAASVRHYLVKDTEENTVKWYDQPVANSREAYTEYRVLQEINGFFLVEMHPITGRSHQLRVLMRSKRCPIAGDVKYNGRKISSPQAILLHARELSFMHPVKKEEIHIIAPLPDLIEWRGIE